MVDMTVAEVAAACGVTERTVRRWLSEGRLAGLRVGGRVRIPAHAVRELSVPYTAGAEALPMRPDATTDLDRGALARERRAIRAERLLGQVRSMTAPTDEPNDAVALVRAGRDDPRSLT